MALITTAISSSTTTVPASSDSFSRCRPQDAQARGSDEPDPHEEQRGLRESGPDCSALLVAREHEHHGGELHDQHHREHGARSAEIGQVEMPVGGVFGAFRAPWQTVAP